MGRHMAIAASAAAIALAGCGGSSGGGTPPITDRGAAIVVPASDVARANLLEIQGNTTNTNTLYIEEGALRVLLRQTVQLDQFTREFQSSDGSIVARLTIPAGLRDLGSLGIQYTRGGEIFVSESVFGRSTILSQMPSTGVASFRGSPYAELTLVNGSETSAFRGDAIITADFGAGTVRAVLDFSGDASAFLRPINQVEISDMAIVGNRFSGGALTSRLGTTPVPEFSNPTDLDSSGLFAGPGAAEAGGVFLARFPGDRQLAGRYLAPRQ